MSLLQHILGNLVIEIVIFSNCAAMHSLPNIYSLSVRFHFRTDIISSILLYFCIGEFEV